MDENQDLKIKILPGSKDFLPRDQEFFTYIKKVIRHRCRQAGFRRISTPLLESTTLFETALGVDSPLLNQIYSFADPEGTAISLKFDNMIGAVRAYLGNKLEDWPQPVQFFYIEPYCRFLSLENKKNLRQGYQFGMEIIGEEDPALEAQAIHLNFKVLQDLGIAHLFNLQINHLGCEKCREKFLTQLGDFYYGKERSLCENCRKMITASPLRLLSCEKEDCKILAELAPRIEKYRCNDCVSWFTDLKSYLTELAIPFTENYKLSREFDYFTGTVYEYWNQAQGKIDVLGGGGRFDDLLKKLSGKALPAFGIDLSLEKMVDVMKKEKIKVPSKDNLHVFIAQLGQDAKKKCLLLMNDLREAGIKTVGTLAKGSMREQLQLASQFKVPYMILMGLTEVREGTVIMREMQTGTQRFVKLDDVVPELIKVLGKDELDLYSPGEVIY